MGISIFSSDSYPETPATLQFNPTVKVVQFNPTVKVVLPGQPDPANYRIIDTLTFGNVLIVEIQYPDCKNYEGKKLLVYQGISATELRAQKLIDPHFSNNKRYASPIARFEPTEKGWRMAESFAKMWSMKK